MDVDFHHGNGTQEIFYEREDVFFASIHRSPEYTYPFFSGYENERGAGAGLGFNLNIPLPIDTRWNQYETALHSALEKISLSNSSALIVSLGVDTYAGDPVGGLGLQPIDLWKMGSLIGEIGIPILVVMEGGYAHGAVGNCVSSFLCGLTQNPIIADLSVRPTIKNT